MVGLNWKRLKTRRSALRAMETARPSRGVFTRRAMLLAGGQLGIFGFLGHRLYDLQLVEGAHMSALAARNRTSKRLLAPARGAITDRFGVPLAGNSQNWRALLMPEETTDIHATVDHFAQIIPLEDFERTRISRDIKNLRRYVPILLKEFLSWDDMARIEAQAFSLPGVLVDVGLTRTYPFGPQLAHIVGYVAPPTEKDVAKTPLLALPGMRAGREGIEQTQDDLLRGAPGMVEMEVNAYGRVLGELERVEGAQGDRVELTIDAGLQQMVLGRIADEYASAVVMDCRDGAILAMTSTPSFDPALFDSGVSHAQWKAWMSDPNAPLTNKAVAGVYPPGSTFKPAVALAALKSGLVTEEDRFDCPGYYDLGGTRFHCWRKHGHGSVNMRQALRYSCDVYFYKVAQKIGMDQIKDMASPLGLGVTLPVELPHVRAGNVPTPAWRRKKGHHWNRGDTVVVGIGQGFVQTTPLELATYAARIASGREVSPHLIRRTVTREGVKINLPAAPGLELQPEWLDVVRGGMFDVINAPDGTATRARLDLPGIQMAGKTGSAQVRRVSRAQRESGHFNSMKLPWEQRPHALFICYAPFDKPRYAVAVVVEHGNGGAATAAPLARLIMTDALQRDPSGREHAPGVTVAEAG